MPREAMPIRLKEAPVDLDGLLFELSDVMRPGGPGVLAPRAETRPMDADRVQALLARTDPLERAERAAFALRKGSPPPPRPGEEVQQAWPPPSRPDVAPDVASGDLSLKRYAPEGDVRMAPHISMTFSQPMVSVTSQDTASQTVPATVEPAVEGRWRWLGTKTLLFDPDPRLPMATEFTVSVPAGTTSALDVELKEASTFTFRTPPVSTTHVSPTGQRQPLDPLIHMHLDQRIDVADILPFVRLEAGSQSIVLRAASTEEIEADTGRHPEIEADRRLILKPETRLRPATDYTLILAKGAPSAEGPRVTETDQRFSFRTYDPLTIQDDGCWKNQDGCNPDGELWIRTNNELTDDAAEHITVEPEIPGMRVRANGSWIHIGGALPARSSVTVVLHAELQDSFGQSLGREQRRSFKIGSARPILMGPGKDQVVLDPNGPAHLPIYSRNIDSFDLEIYRITAEDLPSMLAWVQDSRRYNRRKKTVKAPLPPVFSGQRTVDNQADALVETLVDLDAYLDGTTGQFIVAATAKTDRDRQTRVMTWVQRSRLGMTAFADNRSLTAWVTDLQTGSPIEGAKVKLLGAAQGATTTDAEGLAKLAPYASRPALSALVATRDGDTAVLSQHQGLYPSRGWMASPTTPSLRWLVFDDRGMYKPKEEARFKGIVRGFVPEPGRGLEGFAGTGRVQWRLVDAQGAKIAEGTAPVSETGGFDIRVADLGESPNLGSARLDMSLVGGSIGGRHVHVFQIQEFRRPEFEVSTSTDPRPYVLGEHAIATVDAAYYSGEPLPGAEATWNVTASPGSWRPTGWRDFSFGTWRPWWRSHYGSSGTTTRRSLSGVTGADGSHSVRMDFLAMKPAQPTSVRAEASVVDVNRQRWTSATTLLVHPADRYVGLKLARGFVRKDDKVELEAIVVDLDGKAVADVRVDVAFERLEWKREKGEWKQVPSAGEGCALTSAAEPVACELRPNEGGTWRITASLEDGDGRINTSTRTLWVSGGGSQRPERGIAMEEVLLVPDREDVSVGDTLQILVQAPFWPAEGLMTLRQDGLLESRRFTMEGPSTTLELPLTEAHVPNVHVEVDLVGQAGRVDDAGEPLPDAPKRVAYASGALDLKVPPTTRTLGVDVQPDAKEVRPGAKTEVRVLVTDADGAAVKGAEVALWIVDEAVLALSGYETPDPIATFYPARRAGMQEAHLRSRVLLVDPDTLAGAMGGGAAGGDAVEGEAAEFKDGGTGAVRKSRARAGRAEPPPAPAPMTAAMAEAEMAPGGARTDSSPITTRSDFRALALFVPAEPTDAKGAVRVPVDLPDNLTRYRIMAVVADAGVRFGSGEAELVARQPLMLRPSPPRFLNVGDRAELPFVVQNPTNEPVTVDLALAVDNARILDSVDQDLLSAEVRQRGGLTFVVPAEDRREVRFPVGVADAGTLRFQAVVASNTATDAATDDFPIWTPATTEAFATYGSIADGGMVQPIEAPTDAWPQYGGLEITTSSTQLQALTDALLYLNEYPYACTEQISSRVLANAALRDVLDAFEADQLPSAEVLEARVEADLDLLAKRQRRSGGFAYWGRDNVYPLPSLHAVHALVRARDNGWETDPQVLQRGLAYAARIDRHIPGWYSEDARRTIQAYAIYVRHRAGDDDGATAKKLARHGTDGLSLEAQAWLLPTLSATKDTSSVQAILRNLDNKAVETAAAASFSDRYTDTSDYVLLHSNRRTDAVIVESLLEVKPESDLIEKVVRGLLGHRRKGRWSSTQENSFVLLALHRYFHVYEGVTPDFVAKAWLDDGFAGERAFRGRTTERSHLDIPMAWLQDGPEKRRLTLTKEGDGRLYYRIGMRYAPLDLSLPAADYGFSVERIYEPIDDPDDVTRDADGTWRVKAGAQVRVRLTMVAESRRTMVALVDPLPGGFEPQNPALAVSSTPPPDPAAAKATPYWWWSRPWYNHQNLRDERAEAFADMLWAGVHEYTYVAVATTPGRYVVPPAKAEEMYHPETFGRSAGERVIIE